MRNFDLNFSERRIFVFSDVCMTLRSSFESCVKSMKIPAVLCLEIRKQTVLHLSLLFVEPV